MLSSRNTRLGIAAAGLVVGLILASLPGGTDVTPRVKAARNAPNVVMILVDDANMRDVEVLRKTKRLLARRGTTFSRYFATFPLCCPARATLLTGQYAHNHDVFSNHAPNGGFPGFDDDGSLPQSLQGAGYRTAWIGKYMNAYGKQNEKEIPDGWDKWVAPVRQAHKMWGYTLNQNGNIRKYRQRKSDYQTDVYAGLARRAIKSLANRNRPFFTVLSVLAPHGEPRSVGRINPRPAPRDKGAFKHQKLPQPPSFNERNMSDKPNFLIRNPVDSTRRAQLRNNYRSRRASMLAVDDAVAGIMRTLRKQRELGRTYVIFNSDNGFMLGEHRQRGKVDLYEESARVPLIIRGPRVPKGKTRRQVVGNVDIVPTILDIANAEPLRTPDGLSLLPFMARANHYKDRVILLENRDSQGVRTRRYVYIEHHRGGDEIVHWELYDLKHDPFQLQNLIGPNDTQTRVNLPEGVKPGEVQQVRTNLAGLLDQLRDCAGSACSVP